MIDELLEYVPNVEPVDLTGIEPDSLRGWLQQMVLIRSFEEATEPLSLNGKIPAGVHQAVGQEAVAVGTAAALAAVDIVASSHRAHHHALAKGISAKSVMAELFGRETGCAGGRGGTMHLVDFELGFYGSNGIVGAGVGLALGAALAAHMQGIEQVAVGSLGDGGANTGRVWEAVNLAAVWKLPLIVLCENNLYAVETALSDTMGAASIATRASAFGIRSLAVDGQDVCSVYREVTNARAAAARGEGPTFLEVTTYRYHGHSAGERPTAYRTDSEILDWRRRRDPIARLCRTMMDAGTLNEDELRALEEQAKREVTAAVDYADHSPWPSLDTAARGVLDDDADYAKGT